MRYLILAILLLISCGKDVETITYPENGSIALACSVTQTDAGATITCPDGSSANLTNGENGQDGECKCHHEHDHDSDDDSSDDDSN